MRLLVKSKKMMALAAMRLPPNKADCGVKGVSGGASEDICAREAVDDDDDDDAQ